MCSSLQSITIPDSITTISGTTFMECSSLISITIPNSVTSICAHAFWGCSSLQSITIPNSVTTIGGCPFEGCRKLVVNIQRGTNTSGWERFWNYDIKSTRYV
jgi:hypothetical protein